MQVKLSHTQQELEYLVLNDRTDSSNFHSNQQDKTDVVYKTDEHVRRATYLRRNMWHSDRKIYCKYLWTCNNEDHTSKRYK